MSSQQIVLCPGSSFIQNVERRYFISKKSIILLISIEVLLFIAFTLFYIGSTLTVHRLAFKDYCVGSNKISFLEHVYSRPLLNCDEILNQYGETKYALVVAGFRIATVKFLNINSRILNFPIFIISYFFDCLFNTSIINQIVFTIIFLFLILSFTILNVLKSFKTFQLDTFKMLPLPRRNLPSLKIEEVK